MIVAGKSPDSEWKPESNPYGSRDGSRATSIIWPPLTNSAMPKRNRKSLTESIGELMGDVMKLGYPPTLVGGMALALLESNRVTKDFDFLIEDEARKKKELMKTFYKHGFELVSKLDERGNIVRTVDNPNVAYAKLNMDPPKSAHFFNRGLDLRVDLLFDFPIPAKEVAQRARRRTIKAHLFLIADKQDLITMKEIAVRDRRNPSDVQDLDFLRSLKN